MTNLTFYGGVGEIGGNKVLVEDRDARIWLDMGSTFDFGSEYFVEYLTPRERFGLRDYFALGLLPRLPGLYAADWLESAGLPHEAPRFSAAFISHIHFDHTNHLRFLDAAIPVHLGIGTKIILDSWEITTRGMDLLAHDYRTFRTGGSMDVDRMRTFVEVAKAVGRKFVVQARAAHLLVSLSQDARIQVPDVQRDQDLLVYDRRFERQDTWEKNLFAQLGDRVVTSDYVRDHQDELVVQLDFTTMPELVDIRPLPGSTFIHSKSEPIEADNEVEDADANWLRFV